MQQAKFKPNQPMAFEANSRFRFRTREKKTNFLLLICFIFFSATPFIDERERLIFTGLLAVLIFCYNQNRFFSRFSDTVVLAIFFWTLVFFGLLLDSMHGMNFDFVSVGFFISIFIGFLLSQCISKDLILEANARLVHWSIIAGLPIYILLQLFPSFLSYGLDYEIGPFLNKTFIITNVQQVEDFISNRFVGFSREPGATLLFYLLALWYRLKCNNGRVDFSVVLIFVAVLLGRSTAGFFMIFLVLFVSMPLRSFFRYTLLFGPILAYYVVDQFYFHLSHKLVGTDSFASRYDRYLSFFNESYATILFGYGNSHYSYYIAPYDLGGWDTLLQLSQRYGLVFFVFLVLVLFYNNLCMLPAALIISILFLSQSIWASPFVAFFYFRGQTFKRMIWRGTNLNAGPSNKDDNFLNRPGSTVGSQS